MRNFFGKKKVEKIPEPEPDSLDVTSQKLGERMDQNQLKLDAIDAQLKNQLKIVQETRNPAAKASARKKAMMLLKRKKLYENQMNALANTQMNVDSANLSCQMMNDNMNVMKVMAHTVKVQQDTLHQMGGIDKMYDVMDDMQELKEQQDEINEEFQRNYDVDVEDADLDAELDELDYQMRVEMDNDQLKAPNEMNGPVVNKDEADLEEALK